MLKKGLIVVAILCSICSSSFAVLPSNLGQREYGKFTTDTSGNTAVRVKLGAGETLGATSLTGLSDVSTATATAGRLLVSDGTDWKSVSSMAYDFKMNNSKTIWFSSADGLLNYYMKAVETATGTPPILQIYRYDADADISYLQLANFSTGGNVGLLSEGSIGIGVTSPSAQLHFSTGTIKSDGTFVFTPGTSGSFQIQATGDLILNGGSITSIQTDSEMQLTTGSNDNIYIIPHGTGDLSITADPDTDLAVGTSMLFVKGSTSSVGIGTTAPSEPLHVNGDVKMNDCLMLDDSDGSGWTMITVANGTVFGTVDADGVCD